MIAGAYPHTGRAYRLRLALDDFWSQPPGRAAADLERWCGWASRSRLGPLVEFAAMVRAHWDGILRWASSRISNGVLEAIASLDQAAKRRARGHRTAEPDGHGLPRRRQARLQPRDPHEIARSLISRLQMRGRVRVLRRLRPQSDSADRRAASARRIASPFRTASDEPHRRCRRLRRAHVRRTPPP